MPSYHGEAEFEHDSAGTTGVLLVNLGTPDDPSPGAVRRYLREFLSDPRVIETPRWLWLTILHGIILRIRPARSAAAYRKIWTSEGSPLLTISQRLTKMLGGELHDATVELGMSYGNPSISSALDKLRARRVRRLIVLPLYPQYSATTVGTVFDLVAKHFNKQRWIPELSFVTHYHDRPAFIQALAASVRRFWEANGRGERLLFSFHGIPKSYLLKGDPYHCQCLATARLVATELGLEDAQWHVSFQSRVGREEWLRPYTDDTMRLWGGEGVGDIDVVCPGFSIDCLETLEEIAMQNRDLYQSCGGGELRYVPCLNDSSEHVEFLSAIVQEKMRGLSTVHEPLDDLSARCARAKALGAER